MRAESRDPPHAEWREASAAASANLRTPLSFLIG